MFWLLCTSCIYVSSYIQTTVSLIRYDAMFLFLVCPRQLQVRLVRPKSG